MKNCHDYGLFYICHWYVTKDILVKYLCDLLIILRNSRFTTKVDKLIIYLSHNLHATLDTAALAPFGLS